MSNDAQAGTDRVTRTLLGAIAAGIWALVLLQAWQATKVQELMTEVYAIGADTQAIHDDLDPPGHDDAEDSATSTPRRGRPAPHVAQATATAGRGPAAHAR